MGAGLHGDWHVDKSLCQANATAGADGSGERLHDRFRADGRLAGADASPLSGPRVPCRPSERVVGQGMAFWASGLADLLAFIPLALGHRGAWGVGLVSPSGLRRVDSS